MWIIGSSLSEVCPAEFRGYHTAQTKRLAWAFCSFSASGGSMTICGRLDFSFMGLLKYNGPIQGLGHIAYASA